jgi:2-polyprenyl-3-methyl-5-hydroxy-6-metoxy-1,4-benzoquinol methylase
MTVPLFSPRILPLLKAPGQGDDTTLALAADGLVCPQTGAQYPLIGTVPSLYQPSPEEGADVTARIRSFYEETPFPSYEGLEEFGELVAKGQSNPFSRQLLDAIGYGQTVLECGCGTGQLSHFLQLNANHTLGIDLSLASLGLAIEHKTRNQLARASFCQMNIFDLAIRDDAFDVVISHGVLHHTFDARRAFASIVKKCKPGGIVMVGLYNRPSRFPTWARSKLIRLLGPKIDYVVRNRIHDARKAEVWIKDQYFNPHETWHSIGEVLGWFKENDIEFLNCSPSILDSSGEAAKSLFERTDPGTAWTRAVTQWGWFGTIAREGALFDMIGRRKG